MFYDVYVYHPTTNKTTKIAEGYEFEEGLQVMRLHEKKRLLTVIFLWPSAVPVPERISFLASPEPSRSPRPRGRRLPGSDR